MALTPFQGTLGIKRAAHLLRRATFGGTRPQIDAFANLSATEAMDLLFHRDLPEAPPPNDTETGQEWMISGNTEANSEERERWQLALDTYQGYQIYQERVGDRIIPMMILRLQM